MWRPGWSWLAWRVALAFSVVARSSVAAPEPVHLSCDLLSADESAELEARIRASLLTEPSSRVQVRIHCEFELATVLAVAGDRSGSAVIPLPNASLKETLLAAVERALAELEHQALDATTGAQASTVSLSRAVAPSPVVPAVAPKPAAKPVPAVPSAPIATRRLHLGASVLGARWTDAFAYGAQVRIDASVRPWTAGLALGGLTSAENNDFRVAAWHALAFGAFDAAALADLEAKAGVGLSLLVATPSSGVVARSGNALPSFFVELGVARPFRTRHVSIVPELDLRVSSGRRDIVVDGSAVLALPVVYPLAAVSVLYEL